MSRANRRPQRYVQGVLGVCFCRLHRNFISVVGNQPVHLQTNHGAWIRGAGTVKLTVCYLFFIFCVQYRSINHQSRGAKCAVDRLQEEASTIKKAFSATSTGGFPHRYKGSPWCCSSPQWCRRLGWRSDASGSQACAASQI